MNDQTINSIKSMTRTAKDRRQWRERMLVARHLFGDGAIFFADATVFAKEDDMSVSVHPYHNGGLDTPIVGYDVRHYVEPDWDDEYSIATNYPVSEIVLA